MAIAVPVTQTKNVPSSDSPEAIRSELLEKLGSGSATNGVNTKNLMRIDADQVHKLLALYDNYELRVKNLAKEASTRGEEPKAEAYRKLADEFDSHSRQLYDIQVSVIKLRADIDACSQLSMSEDMGGKESVSPEPAAGFAKEGFSQGEVLEGGEWSDDELSFLDTHSQEPTLAQLRESLSERFRELRATFSRVGQEEANKEGSVGFANWTDWKQSLSSLDALENSAVPTVTTVVF
ncbi:hypothetical protein QFC24_006163 [Naganishia onofrii]|uniref:Uncharacterized protein n=1 Tax=Naganishia onofrii TaxID=1851511 RepID=A0ACC2X377_9TREE|nr:hypothetical protein QFC24_006163 [Naganishia onofrii]